MQSNMLAVGASQYILKWLINFLVLKQEPNDLWCLFFFVTWWLCLSLL